MQHTQIGVSLSLVVVTRQDDAIRLQFAHLADVTLLLFRLWALGQVLDRLTVRVAHVTARWVVAVEEFYYSILGWLAEPVEIPWPKTLLETMSETLLKTYLHSFLARYDLIWEVFDNVR